MAIPDASIATPLGSGSATALSTKNSSAIVPEMSLK
jgi:hypothetical protein